MPDLLKTIGDLPGPQFLLAYTLFALAVIVITWFIGRRLAAGTHDDPLVIPRDPDPWEIACLRGGENEVARLGVLRLVQNGLLQETKQAGKSRVIHSGAPSPDGFQPTRLERAILEFHQSARAPGTMFHPFSGIGFKLRDIVRSEMEPDLRRRGLLVSGSDRTLSALVITVAIALLVSVAAWKLGLAQARGKHNIGFLIMLTLISVLMTPLLGWVGRVSARGLKYVRQLAVAFEGLKDDVRVEDDGFRRGDAERALLLAGVFGMGSLSGSSWSNVSEWYRRSAASNSGCGCGGATVSSCGAGSGGGGCGGGCGGCGGCGG
jgi:uncharacterized protein (TIGR04222 family)